MELGPFILGIDVGGSGLKAGLFKLDGTLVRSGYSKSHMTTQKPGQVEFDGELWWQQMIQAVQQTIVDIPKKKILAVGVSNTNGLIAVGSDGHPLRPAIMLWDQRATNEINKIKEIVGASEVHKITGNPLAPGTYALPTILWLQKNQPEIFNSTFKFMVPGGYLIALLTGNFTIDYSRACTTLLFDICKLDWHTPFLQAFQIPIEKMPIPLASNAIAGTISEDASRLTGLLQGTPVVAGCSDTIAAAIGSGSLQPGEYFIIMGTAARVCTTLDSPSFDQRFMNVPHVIPDHWLAIGALNGGGSSLRWALETFGQLEQDIAEFTKQNAYNLLTSQAFQAPAGSKGLLFLPYISGERTPIWDPYARATFLGITLSHDRNDFLRSILEGTAFAIRQTIEILTSISGDTIQELRIGGAAATSAVWDQIISDVLGKKIVSLHHEHTEVLGAAISGGVGIGAYQDYPSALRQVDILGHVFHPHQESHDIYNQMYEIYEDIYPDIKRYFERLAQISVIK